MKKVQDMSVEGLRVLRTESECRLAEWNTQEAQGAVIDPKRREHLRTAVREASDRLAKADAHGEG